MTGVDVAVPIPAPAPPTGEPSSTPSGGEFPLRVELPKGHHAMIRDPDEVSERQRRMITKAQMRLARHASAMGGAQALAQRAEQLTGEGADAANDEAIALMGSFVESGAMDDIWGAVDVAAAVLVQSWSFAGPVTAEAIVDLPGPTYDALMAVVKPLASALSVDFDPNPDPASPTRPSSG